MSERKQWGLWPYLCLCAAFAGYLLGSYVEYQKRIALEDEAARLGYAYRHRLIDDISPFDFEGVAGDNPAYELRWKPTIQTTPIDNQTPDEKAIVQHLDRERQTE